MKTNIYIILVTLLFSLPSFAKEVKTQRQARLLSLIEEELTVVKKVKKKSARLRFRILGLLSEKTKVLKEIENANFMANFIKHGGKKSDYFKRSSKMHDEILAGARKLIRQYPNNPDLSEIYYLIGLNNRDYGDGKLTERYLKKALRNARKGSHIIHKANVALAEFYYNEKKYERANKLYKHVLKNKKDEWYTKHLYNFGWCQFKVKNYSSAINSLKEAYEKRNDGYINIEELVLESISTFFVYANQISEGIIFYESEVDAPSLYLLSMAKKIASKGDYVRAENVFTAAEYQAKSLDEKLQLSNAKLEFYRQFKKDESFYKSAQSFLPLGKSVIALKEDKEKVEEYEDLNEELQAGVEKIKDYTGYLQMVLIKDMKKSHAQYSEERYDRIIRLFNLMNSLNPEQSHYYRFMQGETSYAVHAYKSAINYYFMALTFEQTDQEKDKVFNSLFSVLAKNKLEQKFREEKTLNAYSEHIKFWPSKDKSYDIYLRKFKLHQDRKEIDQMIATFNLYKKNNPKDNKTEKTLVTNIINFLIKATDTSQLTTWLLKTQRGIGYYTQKEITDLTNTLGSLLFKKNKELSEKGKISEAIRGYKSLYENKDYPSKIKADAAFNMALLYLKESDTVMSSKWMSRSWKLYTNEELYELKSNILSFVDQTVLQQDFKNGAALATHIYTSFCGRKYEEESTLFEKTIQYNLLTSNYNTSRSLLKSQRKCDIPNRIIIGQTQKILDHFHMLGEFHHYFSLINESKQLNEIQNTFDKNLVNLYWHCDRNEIHYCATESYGHIQQKRTKTNLQSALVAYHRFHTQFRNFEWSNLDQKVGEFDIDKFQTNLQNNFVKIKSITNKANAIIALGEARSSASTYFILQKIYGKLASAIRNVTPLYKDDEFVKQFKKETFPVAASLDKKKNSIKKQTLDLIEKNELLISSIKRSTSPVDLKHDANIYFATMDL